MNLSTENVANPTTVERISDCEVVVSRVVNGPVHLVFKAWTDAEHFRKWWVPKSYGLNLVDCQMDVRVGGQYRLIFLHEGSNMEFFGTYLEVVPNTRIMWTNEEGGDDATVTTVTFEDQDGKTLLKIHDRYPNAESVDTGSTGAMPEVLQQLDELLSELSG